MRKDLMRKFGSVLLAACVGAAACACSTTPPAASGDISGTKQVGVSMPTRTIQRFVQDGDNMKAKLEEKGYTVDLQYAQEDVQKQVAQLENMIANGVDCLVILPQDSVALVNVLKQAKAADIPVIAYDRLLMDTDTVTYYATFDNTGVGRKIGEYVETALGLKEGKGPYHVEFFAGSQDDNNAHMLNAGMFEILQPYLDNGQLVCPSGQTDFDVICTPSWSQEKAQQRMENLLSGFYTAGEKLDAVVCANDVLSYGIIAALDGGGYTPGENWPLITGQDAEIMSIKNIIAGKQTQTVFKDTRILADKCVTMVQAVLEGAEPEINDTTTYNNNVLTVPSYLCEPVSVDKNNFKQVLIDSGYYTAEELGLNS